MHQFCKVKGCKLQPILAHEGRGNTERHCIVCSPSLYLRPKKLAMDICLGMGFGMA